MVKINAGSVHRAINNLGFFTTLVHLFKFKEVNKRGKEAQIIYSPVYASCIDFNHCFYDCAYGKCHLSVFYQFHCT